MNAANRHSIRSCRLNKIGVQQSLEKVPAILPRSMVLRFQEEMQLDEISGVTGAPISTVKSRLYRGLGR